jgi:DNA-binding response OmpR family regulator
MEARRNARDSKRERIVLDLHMPGLDGCAVAREGRSAFTRV